MCVGEEKLSYNYFILLIVRPQNVKLESVTIKFQRNIQDKDFITLVVKAYFLRKIIRSFIKVIS